jgi:hypothetical protein
MGLDTSHDCWHGAYSAFTRWRNKLAEVAGYYVEEGHIRSYRRDGAPDHTEHVPPNVCLDWGHVTEGNLYGDWETIPHNMHGYPDPLLILLAHADCDGWIRHQHCAPLADRLQELLPLLPDEQPAGHIGHWHTKTQQFVDGLRAAHAAGEDVEFA